MILKNISDLKLTPGTTANQYANVLGYYAPGDKGGGDFYWDDTSIEDENGGTIFEVTGTATGRWKRNYSDAVNVCWFGAKGNGVTDDTIAIQSAVNSISKIGGGILNFVFGRYAVTHIDFFGKTYSNITLVGNNCTILPIYTTRNPGAYALTYGRFRDADAVFLFQGSTNYANTDIDCIKNIHISGFNFWSDIEAKQFDEISHHVAASGISGLYVDNCTFTGFLGDGISITEGYDVTLNGGGYNQNVHIENCTFDGVNNDNRNAISIYYCDLFSIKSCDFRNCTRGGMPGCIDIEPNTDLTINRGGIIESCKFFNTPHECGVNVSIASGTTALDNGNIPKIKISGCVFKDIAIPVAVTGGIGLDYENMIVFEDNICDRMGVPFFLNGGVGLTLSRNIFTNIGDILAGDNITLITLTGCRNIKILNNTFDNWGHNRPTGTNPGDYQYGLCFSSNGILPIYNVTISGNTFRRTKRHAIVFLTVPEKVGNISMNTFIDDGTLDYPNVMPLMISGATPVAFGDADLSGNVSTGTYMQVEYNHVAFEVNYWWESFTPAQVPFFDTTFYSRGIVFGGDVEHNYYSFYERMKYPVQLGSADSVVAVKQTLVIPALRKTVIRYSVSNSDWSEWFTAGFAKMGSQDDSTASTLTGIVADFNSLLVKLKSAGLMS